MEFQHYSVMLNECMEHMRLSDGGIYFDGTCGGGGHTGQILARTSPSGRVISVDRDAEAIAAAKLRLGDFAARVTFVNDNFKNVNFILDELGIDLLNGAILDLGVSSYQLDNFDRGFSYRSESAPLDMRMDEAQAFSAYQVVNEYSEEMLTKIFFQYGEEKFSRRIAANLVKARQEKPLQTCGELVNVITRSIPAAARRTGGHPAKRVFQAIRIEVNRELDGLDQAVTDIVMRLKPGGRLCVLTFHSLEDRIVKQAFKELEKSCICDKSAPICTCGKRKEIDIITKKPITASEEELNENNRSQSAKLRVAERV